MGLPQGSEWILIILVVVLLFGAKKLPDAARGLGRSLRIFKSEVKQMDQPVDEVPGGATAVTPAAIVQAPVQTPAPVQTQAPAQPYLPPPPQAPAQAYVPVNPPVQVQTVAQPAPVVADVTPVHTDPTSVQSVNERFYGQDHSER